MPDPYSSGTKVKVARIPDCDVCKSKTPPKKRPAKYDARTWTGRWAFLCTLHWLTETQCRLGTGYGQELILDR